MKYFVYFVFIVLLHAAYSLDTTDIQYEINVPVAKGVAVTDVVLSRKRRFLVPQVSGWTFKLTFNLGVPIEGLGSSLSIDLPVTYAFDDGR